MSEPITNEQHLSESRKRAVKIETGYGPEDMAIDLSEPSVPRLIISCTQFNGMKKVDGGIWYYPLSQGLRRAHRFALEGYDSSVLRPHGICLHQQNGKPFLYVISHEQKDKVHKILKFELSAASLKFLEGWDSHTYPQLRKKPNDLFVDPEGGIYFTNPGGFLGPFLLRRRRGTVAYLSPKGICSTVVDKIGYPNGVTVRDGFLYVTATAENQLLRFPLRAPGKAAAGSRECLAVINGADNITSTEESLVIAQHPDKWRFLLHGLFHRRSPSAIQRYRLKDRVLEELFYSDGVLISGSSTAILYEGKLYISQVLDNYILEVPV